MIHLLPAESRLYEAMLHHLQRHGRCATLTALAQQLSLNTTTVAHCAVRLIAKGAVTKSGNRRSAIFAPVPMLDEPTPAPNTITISAAVEAARRAIDQHAGGTVTAEELANHISDAIRAAAAPA